ncbi:MAG: hypothetical protein HY329_23460 [Chloroflexi bacterium]|nr:hypothetical protein [Chloroflexota bacterium]
MLVRRSASPATASVAAVTAFFDRRRARPPGILPLVGAGAVLQLSWLLLWPLSYPFTRGSEFTDAYLVTQYPALWRIMRPLLDALRLLSGTDVVEPTAPLLAWLAATLVLAGASYVAALWILDCGAARCRGAGWVVLGFTALFQTTLLLMPGIFTTDVFSYLMYGRISGLWGLNPYVAVPAQFPDQQLLQWIHPLWHEQPSVYGPMWEQVGRLLAPALQPLSLVDQTLVYKLLTNVVRLANLGLVWWLLGRFRPGDGSDAVRLTAFTIFAWNPLLLFEIAGNAHNDGLMVTLLFLSLIPLAGLVSGASAEGSGRLPRARLADGEPSGGARVAHQESGRWLAASALIGLSALVKYTTAVVGIFFVAVWLRRLPTWRARALWLAGGAALMLGLTLVLAWPWLQLEALAPLVAAAGGKLYQNSVPDVLAHVLATSLFDPFGRDPETALATSRFWVKVVARGLFLAYLAYELRRLWPAAGRDANEAVTAALAAATRALLVLLLVVLTWVLTWYFTWPLALATLLGWRSQLARVAVGYTITALPVFYVHHYWYAVYQSEMPDALLFFYAVPPLLIPMVERLRLARVQILETRGAPSGRPVTSSFAPERAQSE